MRAMPTAAWDARCRAMPVSCATPSDSARAPDARGDGSAEAGGATRERRSNVDVDRRARSRVSKARNKARNRARNGARNREWVATIVALVVTLTWALVAFAASTHAQESSTPAAEPSPGAPGTAPAGSDDNGVEDANGEADGAGGAEPDAAASPPGTPSTIVDVAATWPMDLVLPDSELVFGPTAFGFDTAGFLERQGGGLATYVEIVGGQPRSAAEIVDLVSAQYSVGSRLLLALVEMESGSVRGDLPAGGDYAGGQAGLYGALAAAADALNAAYYAHRVEDAQAIVLQDGAAVEVPGANAGTFAVLAYLTRGETRDTWSALAAPTRFYAAWTGLFGDAHDFRTMDPIPESLPQEELSLPFAQGQVWFYVAGPHPPWGTGAPRAAIDFAPPPPEQTGCHLSGEAVLAAAAGVVTRSDASGVVVDLDADGFEGTGWTHVYTHLSSVQRVEPGARVDAGDPLGFPSCEGGLPTQSRVAFSRRYNGEWLPADAPAAPMSLSGWSPVAGEAAGEGWLTHVGLEPREASPAKDPARNGIAAIPEPR